MESLAFQEGPDFIGDRSQIINRDIDLETWKIIHEITFP